MPPNCWECPSYDPICIDSGICLVAEEDGVCKTVDILPSYDMEKPDWCPLVEVVQCENCLHWDDEKDGVYVGALYHCCDYDGEYKKPCDFCSYGEMRKE